MSNFINDDMVGAALDYLNLNPHPVAITRADVTRAENVRKSAFAKSFLNAEGKNVEERKALAETSPECETAKSHEANSIQKFRVEEARVNSANMVIELWRSVQANERAAERVR